MQDASLEQDEIDEPRTGEASCNGRPYVAVLDVEDDAATSAFTALAIGADQSAWVAGHLAGDATFGGAQIARAGGTDALVARLDACGDVLWAKTFGGAGEERALAIGADDSGHAYVVGTFDGDADFGTGPVSGTALRDAFVLKLDPMGDIVWWKHVEASLDGGVSVVDLDVDDHGNVLVLGHIDGEASLGDATIESNALTGFVAKVDSNGITQWATVLGTDTDAEPTRIVASPNGAAFVAGDDVRGIGLFALALTASGDPSWTRTFHDPDQLAERLLDMAVGADGQPIIAGRGFFGGGVTSEGAAPYFVTKLGRGGSPLWIDVRRAPASHVIARPRGEVLLAGHHCDVPSGATPTGCVVETATYAADGTELDARVLTVEATVTALAADGPGLAVLAGVMSSSKPGDGEPVDAAGDPYVARISP